MCIRDSFESLGHENFPATERRPMILFLSLLLACEVTQLSKIDVIDAAKNILFGLLVQCIKRPVYANAIYVQMECGGFSDEN